MQKGTLFVIIGLLFSLGFSLELRFSGPSPVYDGGTPIDVGNYGAPVIADWNGDGNKDLICGQFTNGKIRYYENIGTDTAPVFNGFEFLKADGVEIELPYG